ncbi:CPBP family intramembrane glutamic endopeptidase [Dyella psychrodurans]|uniref:CPBP family intramembrane metalloprotease n=1 Tax=Dyella psychrodurans TaxID=1927960 RepID=A0A370XDL3_9GAMM|nr:CPBP family intramembrane glutamic endopeptidase [Dyella psychrodurans]RDS86382.1 CPBP family intramembrane metalloprotease [Dyella psychrodurans]
MAAVVIYVALGWLAARITGAHLLDQAQSQLARVENHEPLWEWRLRKPRDLIASRAFGNAKVVSDDDALRIASVDGTPFELGLPIAWSLDLAHWPVLQLELQSSAPGTLGLVWQGPDNSPACLALAASPLTPDTRALRIDLRDLVWHAADDGRCPAPGIAQLLRLRVQIPRDATLRVSSASLATTQALPPLQDTSIDLPAHATGGELERAVTPAQNWAMPLFRLPDGIRAETMLKWRDQLRQRWPAALIVPFGATPQPVPDHSYRALAWLACVLYLVALTWLVLKPVKGRLRPWLDIVGCLLGPLWLVAGLHWGLYPTPLGVTAFAGGLLFALVVERHHLPRLWRWPETRHAWLWPLAPVPVALLLIVLFGHTPHALLLGHVVTYFGWAWLQQWLMLVVLLRRFEQVMPRPGWAMLAVATLFGLFHTPNGLVMQVCFAAELWWVWCFRRSHSVLPIGVAHAVCALLVEASLSGGWMRSLEVSGRFFL